MLKGDRIAYRLDPDSALAPAERLYIRPFRAQDIARLRKSGAASVDLRLGTWFLALRRDRVEVLRAAKASLESHMARSTYVPFGSSYCLHPRTFALGTTLEWLRLPGTLSAYVIGKSSWGRRGLIIATATAVHPGFAGCLTLELSNVGETPVVLEPGMSICQICLHELETDVPQAEHESTYAGRRKPVIGNITRDDVAKALSGSV